MIKIYIILLVLIPIIFCHGESLKVIDEITFPCNKPTSDAEDAQFHASKVFLEGDTIYFTTYDGFYYFVRGEECWKQIIRYEEDSESWYADYDKARESNDIFYISGIWHVNDGDFIFLDGYMDRFYLLDLKDWDDIKIRILKEREESFYDICPYKDLVFLTGSGNDKDYILYYTSNRLKSNIKRVFTCPQGLKTRLDSVWAEPCCHPAFNPSDSTVWLLFNYYNYIYIVDLKGNLIDSVHIDAPDYRLPQPPKSHLKSDAVFQDWLSKCTTGQSFWYVSSGYFIVQYNNGFKKLAEDSVRLRTTLVWSADKQPVELEIQNGWNIVGVQPDGRVIFAYYRVEDNQAKEIVLTIARIEP